ncbi:hypothetical protein M0802_009749 [Mischocyttarus mexicanus]|nr:hypothetical protein M0802_009749 [Mischocyttarus mexicanus]
MGHFKWVVVATRNPEYEWTSYFLATFAGWEGNLGRSQGWLRGIILNPTYKASTSIALLALYMSVERVNVLFIKTMLFTSYYFVP